jgi:hypothetical protein
MILAIYTHKYGADYYLLRNDEEVQKLRYTIASDFWEEGDWTGSPEQVNQYWQDKSEACQEWFETCSITYHYEKP